MVEDAAQQRLGCAVCQLHCADAARAAPAAARLLAVHAWTPWHVRHWLVASGFGRIEADLRTLDGPRLAECSMASLAARRVRVLLCGAMVKLILALRFAAGARDKTCLLRSRML